MEQNYFEKVHRNEITSKRDVQTTLVFDISKNLPKRVIKTATIFCLSETHEYKHVEVTSVSHQNSIKKNISKKRRFIVYQNYVVKSTSK